MGKKITTEEFIAKAKEVHGDLYDYSLVDCVGIDKPITIKCNSCNDIIEIKQARQHLKKTSGCYVCHDAKIKDITTDLSIRKIRKTRPDLKYDFTEYVYKGNQTKATVTCENNHTFKITPNDLLFGYGCKECSKAKMTGRPISFVLTYPDNIKINSVGEIQSSTKVEFECIDCGYSGIKRADQLNKGCPSCNHEEGYKKLYKPFSYYVDKIQAKHKSKYVYHEETYINNKTPMDITCKKHKITFRMSLSTHLCKNRPSGCPLCSDYGFNTNKPAILYYLRVADGENVAYKIGVTNRSVCERYNKNDLSKIEVLMELDYAVGRNAHKREQEILKEFKSEKWEGADILKSGNTELFKIDVLGLDK